MDGNCTSPEDQFEHLQPRAIGEAAKEPNLFIQNGRLVTKAGKIPIFPELDGVAMTVMPTELADSLFEFVKAIHEIKNEAEGKAVV